MTDSLIYVRRSYVKDGAPDISDKDQEAAVRRLFPQDARVVVIRDSYDEDDPTSKRKHSGASEDREGYQEMIRLIRRGGIKRVGIYDLSRLNRNARAMLNLHAELESHGVHLVAADMPGSDLNSAAGRFQFGIMCMAAQYQRDVDVEKGKRRAVHVFQTGGHNGLDPLGYQTVRDEQGKIVRPRNLEVIEHEAEQVRRIFRNLASKSFVQISHDLNAEGDTRRGEMCTVDSVKDVWRRRKFYLGYTVWKRGLEERPGTHPPILDEETYRAAEMGVASRRRAGRANRPHRTYIVSGRAKCTCGASMRGTATLNRGVEWRYYRCGARCGQPSASADQIEQAVVQAVREGALPTRVMQAARDELARRLKVPAAGLSDKKRQRLTTALQRIRDLYKWGEMTEAEYRAEKASLEGSLAEVPDSDKLVQFDQHRKVVLSLAESIDKASPARVRELVGLLVQQITVDDGSVDPEQIVWTPAARPFFDRAMAAVVGLERPRRESNPRRRP